ncbi:lysozyme [Arthrobacter sp. FW306-04-A]|uniref:lysozyme n=1 Tax=Arthrobacter sp. FW306-04-A TaxID=2879619 RepID=UPI0037C00404|nr:lysozyme [Arthrobacter sp. FW306-04-A]
MKTTQLRASISTFAAHRAYGLFSAVLCGVAAILLSTTTAVAAPATPAPSPGTLPPAATATSTPLPSPSATTAPPALQQATPAPTSSPSVQSPTAAPPPTAASQNDEGRRAAMREAAGPGGAQMGQHSPRVQGLLTTQSSWTPPFGIQGIDVSSYQPSVDWQQQWNMGVRFAYVKATEGNYYASPTYSSQYSGSRSVGMIRGAYHFAIPSWSAGADQANYFVQNGGGWTSDGATMPPVLDIEYAPSYTGTNICYGMSPSALNTWIHNFGDTVRALTGRYPMIYSTTDWWKTCLADSTGFSDYPLWIASYTTNTAIGTPSSWSTYSVWQYSSTGPFSGDSNVWNGDYASLQRFAGNPAKGSFDSLSLVRDTTSAYLRVTGWSVDLSRPWVSTPVNISVTGPNNVTTGYSFLANGYRPDVDNAFGYGPAHGFDNNIQITASGTYKVCATAAGANGSVDLGCKSYQASGVEPPIGSFDSLSQVRTPTDVSLRLTGWAIDRANSNTVSFADAYVTDPNGQTVGYRIAANTSRPDVGTATGYGANHGFDKLISLARAGNYHVCVYAIGQFYNTGLGCKDIAVGSNPPPKGYYDSIRIDQNPGAANIVVSGWAFDPTNAAASIPVHVYVQAPDGSNVGTAYTANLSRPDVNNAFGIAGNHGFSASLGVKTPGRYTACAYALAVAPLASGNTALGCMTIQVTNTPIPNGYLDSVGIATVSGQTNIKATGWTYDPAVPGSSTPVHVYITYPDGTRRGYAFTADLPRADVNNAFRITGNHGYSTQVSITQRGRYSVCTYGIGIAQFSSGNAFLGCQSLNY